MRQCGLIAELRCGKCLRSDLGSIFRVAQHFRFCKGSREGGGSGMQVRDNVTGTVSANVTASSSVVDCPCIHCGRSFTSKTGLGLHTLRAHPEEVVIDRPVVGRVWRREELELLARIEVRLGQPVTSKALYNAFKMETGTERTCDGVRGARRNVLYREILEGLLAESDRASVEVEEDASAPDSAFENHVKGLLAFFDLMGEKEIVSSGREIMEGKDLEENFGKLLQGITRVRNKDSDARTTCGKQRNGKAKSKSSKGKRASGKKSDYAKCQDLFWKSKRVLFESIIGRSGGDGDLDPEAAEEYWRGVLEVASVTDDEPAMSFGTCSKELKPVTAANIKAALSRQKGKAPGLDGLGFEDLDSVQIERLELLYNLMLLSRYVPSGLCCSRTVLIPKGTSTGEPSQYRPISIASILLRVLHTAVAQTWGSTVNLHPAQRGFVRCDGALENVSLLNYILTTARREQKGVFMAVLDLTKAFDSVSRDSLKRALKGFGAPDILQSYLGNLYDRSTTVLDLKGKRSSEIKPQRGVRQGDPLSPLIFNMMIDEGIRSLPGAVGYEVGSERVNALAFADDLVLVAKSREGLQSLLKAFEGFLVKRGLSINAAKSFICAIDTDGKRKRTFVCKNVEMLVGGVVMRTLGPDDTFKYLGIEFSPAGRTRVDVGALRNLIAKVKAARLKPEQKILLIKEHVIPRVTHALSLGRVTAGLLDRLDLEIRGEIKEILRLPHYAPDVALYLRVASGGLGLPRLRYSVPLQLKGRLARLQQSSSPVAREYASSEFFRVEVQKVERLLQVGGETLASKIDLQRHWRDRALKTFDSQGVPSFCEYPPANRWLRGGDPYIRGYHFVDALKLRYNLLVNRSTAYKGSVGEHRRCRHGCGDIETANHILQRCSRTHGLRVRRHNEILKFAADQLRKRQHLVWMEPVLRTADGLRKPDLVIVKDGKAWVVDVACPYETSAGICRSFDEKVRYYRRYGSEVRSLVGGHVTDVSFSALVIGARGSVCHKSVGLWQELGMPGWMLEGMAKRAIMCSLRIHRSFMRV